MKEYFGRSVDQSDEGPGCSHIEQIYELEQLGGGRYLGQTYSVKDGGYICVLCTPVNLIKVVDCDSSSERPLFKPLGQALTKRGSHYYYPAVPGVEQALQVGDTAYQRIAAERGVYAERLFEIDGNCRVPPRHQDADDWQRETMWVHRDAFLRAQIIALRHGLQTPQKERCA